MATQRHFGRDMNKRETESPLKRAMGRQRERVICHKDFFPLSSKTGPEFSREQWGFLCRSLSRELWRRHLLFFFCLSGNPPPPPLRCCSQFPIVGVGGTANHSLLCPWMQGWGIVLICQSQNSIFLAGMDI